MRWTTSSLVIGLAFLASANALLESQAGVIDWNKAQLGVPLTRSIATAPSLHAPLRKSRGKTKAPPGEGLLISGTNSNVLGAVHANNGSVAWRWIYEPEDPIIGYHKYDDVVASLSGPGGVTLRTFDYTSGALIVEQRLHKPESARLLEPDHTGASIAFVSSTSASESTDLIVLTEGHVVRKLDSAGKELWKWVSPDQTSQVIYSKIIATPTTTYVVGLSKSFASYTLHVTSLSTSSGEELASANIPSSITDGPSSLLSLYPTTSAPQIVWLESGTIKSVALTEKLHSKPTAIKGASYEQVLDVGLAQQGYFVALKAGDGTARIVKLAEEKEGLKVVWEFADSARSAVNAESMYMGGLDGEGMPYIGRVFWSHALKKGSAHMYAPHLADGKGLVSGFTFAFDTNVHGILTHAALQVPYPQAYDLVPYLSLTTSTGAIQLWQGDRLLWTREESLAHIAVAEMVELPEARDILSTSGDHRTESFIERVQRQIVDAKDLPAYLVHFIKRFATGSYASALTAPTPALTGTVNPTNETAAIVELARDEFGFRKIIVAATEYGKVYGLDSSNGEIVWSRVFGLGWAVEVGAKIVPVKVFVVRAVGDIDDEGKTAGPEVVIVAQRIADNGLVDTVLFHVNALTGENVREEEKKGALLQGFDIIQGPIVDAYLLTTDEAKVVVLLDEFLQVYLYPETAITKSLFASLSPSLHFPLRTGRPGARQLTGHSIAPDSGLSRHTASGPTWQTSLPPAHDIIEIVRKPTSPVASLGKVLGNRTTLYKYLTPTLFAVISGGAEDCAISVLDGAKGSLVYSVVLPGGGGCEDVKASFVENWLVYVFWDGESKGVGEAKGYRMVSVELYEGKGADDKTRSSDMSSYSNKSLDVRAISQSFVFPHGVTALATTSTKFGVTTKDLIVANEKHQIQSFPRRLLDPRRPKQKPTAEEQEEMLFQYDPLIPDDPRRVLSHTYEVANVRQILTSPALLESTSLVFAYGLDLFFTRVTPSGTFDILSENFNKVQLVLTITGLAVAIIVTKPMVARKRLRERWYQ